MSSTHWEVTDVDGINALNPLQRLVSAYDQVAQRDPVGCLHGASRKGIYGPISVGSVLLAMRYGKRGTRELDDLAHCRADTEVGLT
jgi:hypothetical protein